MPFELALVLVRFNHFVIAVWRAKEAESSVKLWENTLAMLAARS
jgi:hypothetical protein